MLNREGEHHHAATRVMHEHVIRAQNIHTAREPVSSARHALEHAALMVQVTTRRTSGAASAAIATTTAKRSVRRKQWWVGLPSKGPVVSLALQQARPLPSECF